MANGQGDGGGYGDGGGGGWGSGGGGGYDSGSSSGGSDPIFKTLTASGLLIDRLFGIHSNKHGTRYMGTDEYRPDLADPYLNTDQFLQNIADYMTQALPMSGLEEYAKEGAMPGSLAMLDRASQLGLEGIETGFRQDVSSLMPLAENIYQDLGDLTRERFAGTNTLQSSGFAQQRAREGKDIAVELSGLQFGEDQAAADRRLQLMLADIVPGLAEARVALPFEFGGQYRTREEAIRGRPYNALMALAGMQPPALTQVGYNPSQEGGWAAIADSIGPLLASIGQFTGGGSGGSW